MFLDIHLCVGLKNILMSQAFARNSPYLPDISEAVLKVSETGKLQKLEHSLTSSLNCSGSTAQPDDTHDSL